ncbi:unnamed protein product [Paramecium sonneborni]|uniref:Transmembrane protein n=1 Tax=Paramecium sonneborni TaxID=65129 RepID=A0A8S1QBE5_9CILI|nr:unnamed protein product [Paramecium sonneborni]
MMLELINFKIIAKNILILNNYLKNSVIFVFDDDIELISVKSIQNTLIESSILSTLLIINQQRVFCIIDDFEDYQSALQESSMITIYSSLQINNFIVIIKNFQVQENKLLNTLYLKIFLFKLHCHSLVIQNAKFLNLQNMAVFYLFEINQIVFDSVILENYQQDHKVLISQYCIDQVQFRSQLLQITAFSNYHCQKLNTQFIIDSIRQVILVNVQFKGNILLKNKQSNQLSLITIFSQYNLNIKLIDIQLIQNIVNQQIDEPLDSQTNLQHINSLDSFVQIHQLYCNQNALTNSTNPFITVTATSLEISNLIFMNSNVLSQTQWQHFYDFELDDKYNQQEINLIIQSTFKILNQGIYVVASTFSCTESFFQEIIAFKSSIFSIKTQGQGIIKINKIQIDSVYTNLQDSGSTGFINIDSTNSLLYIELKQIKFTNIFNRMSASLFTITSSLKQNIIQINNIEIKNSLSFNEHNYLSQIFSINNERKLSNEEVWIKFFSYIGQITQSELENIQREDNLMIYFENCKIELKNLWVEGITISPILKFSNIFKLKLLDCKIISIQKLHSFDLIHLTQTLIIESKIYVEKLKIIQSNRMKFLFFKISIIKLQFAIFGDIHQQHNKLFIPIQQMMYVQSISDQNSLIFQDIELINNNGTDFSDGIITFEVEQFKIFKIINFFCYQNSVKQNGCIYFLIQKSEIRISQRISKSWRCNINLKRQIKDDKLQNNIQLCKANLVDCFYNQKEHCVKNVIFIIQEGVENIQKLRSCISCFGVQDSIIPFIGASICSFISIIIALRSIDQSNQLFKNFKLQQRFSKIIFNLEQGHESFLIKMLLNYLWIYSVIFTFNIKFQFSFTFVDSARNTSYYLSNNLDCYLSENQSIKLIYSKIITMLVLMTFQFMLIIIIILIYNQLEKKNKNLEIISNSLLYLYISNYGGIFQLSQKEIFQVRVTFKVMFLSFLDLKNIQFGFFLCYSRNRSFQFDYSSFSFYCHVHQKRLACSIQIRKHFCYLINEYNNRSYFWEEIKLIKKTIIILILTYFETYILLKASLLGLCLLFYQLLAFKKKPYILSNFNSMDLFSAQICSITIFLSAVQYVSEQEHNQFSSISLSTFIVLFCLKLCYSFIKGILEVYTIKYSFLILKFLNLILNKIWPDSNLTKKLSKHIQRSSQRNERLKFLIHKLQQYLIKISKSQIENHRKILNLQSQITKSLQSELKYLLNTDTK